MNSLHRHSVNAFAEAARADALRALVREDPVLMAQLRAVRALGLASWCIGAGALRRRVWDARFPAAAWPAGQQAMAEASASAAGVASASAPASAAGAAPDVEDVDVVYFDTEPWSPARDAALAERLALACPGPAWDVVHQGHVHHGASARAGREVAPHASLEDGIASWPETATAVGIALREDDALDVLAPLGLADLMDGVVRRNPRCPDARAFDERLASKGWLARWPGLRLVSDSTGS